MSSYSCSVTPISRSQGRSAPASAAYRHGVQLTDERTGEVFDYTRRAGVEDQGLEGANDLAALWRAAESAEKRSNSVVAREVRFSLPHEVSAEERARISREVAADLRQRFGVAASWANHAPGRDGDDRNFHCHLLMTTRAVDAEGTFGAKTRELDAMKSTGAGAIDDIRRIVETRGNDALERAGLPRSLDRRSLAAQAEAGLIEPEAAIPTQHLGPAACAMERRGEITERGDHNRQVVQLRALAREAATVARAIEDTRRQIAAEQEVEPIIAGGDTGELEVLEFPDADEMLAAAIEQEALAQFAAQRAAEAAEVARLAAEVEAAEAAARVALKAAAEAGRARLGTRADASTAIARAEAAAASLQEARLAVEPTVKQAVDAWHDSEIGGEVAACGGAYDALVAARASLRQAGQPPAWWQVWRGAERREHRQLVEQVDRAEAAERSAKMAYEQRHAWMQSPAGRAARASAGEAARSLAERQHVHPAQQAHNAAVRAADAAVERDDQARAAAAAARIEADRALQRLRDLDPERADMWREPAERRRLVFPERAEQRRAHAQAAVERDEGRIAGWRETRDPAVAAAMARSRADGTELHDQALREHRVSDVEWIGRIERQIEADRARSEAPDRDDDQEQKPGR